MTTIRNASTSGRHLYVTVTPRDKPAPGQIIIFPQFEVAPGETYIVPADDPNPTWFGFDQYPNTDPAHDPQETVFWNGPIRALQTVDVYPETKRMVKLSVAIGPEEFEAFQKLFPPEHGIHTVSVKEIMENSANKDYPGTAATEIPHQRPARGILSPCKMKWAGVGVDGIFFVIGLVGIISKFSPSSIENAGEALQPILSDIDEIARKLTAADATTFDQAKAVFDIAKLVYSGGMFEAVFAALMKSLTWWDMLLYGTLGLAELTAAFLTEGAALIALMVADASQLGFVVSDVAKAIEVCGETHA